LYQQRKHQNKKNTNKNQDDGGSCVCADLDRVASWATTHDAEARMIGARARGFAERVLGKTMVEAYLLAVLEETVSDKQWERGVLEIPSCTASTNFTTSFLLFTFYLLYSRFVFKFYFTFPVPFSFPFVSLYFEGFFAANDEVRHQRRPERGKALSCITNYYHSIPRKNPNNKYYYCKDVCTSELRVNHLNPYQFIINTPNLINSSSSMPPTVSIRTV
jgi:hypothetical protein